MKECTRIRRRKSGLARRGEMTLPREVKSRPKLLDFPNAPAPISTPA